MTTITVYTIHLDDITCRNKLMEFINKYTSYIIYECSETTCSYEIKTVKERSLLNVYKQIKLFCSIIGIVPVKVVKELRNKLPESSSESY